MPVSKNPDLRGRVGALRELVRLGEGLIEKQFRIAYNHDQKTRHLMTMNGGVLAIGAVVTGVFSSEVLSDESLRTTTGSIIFVVLLAASFVFSGLSFRLFMMCYLGEEHMDTELDGGWSARNLTKAAGGGDSILAIMESTISGFERWVEENQRSLNHFQQVRRKGQQVLWIGGCLLALALLYGLVISFV